MEKGIEHVILHSTAKSCLHQLQGFLRQRLVEMKSESDVLSANQVTYMSVVSAQPLLWFQLEDLCIVNKSWALLTIDDL